MASTVIVASQNGSFQFFDLQNESAETKVYELDTDGIIDLAMSNTGEVMAFGDAA